MRAQQADWETFFCSFVGLPPENKALFPLRQRRVMRGGFLGSVGIYLPHLSLLVLGEQGAVEVLQRQLGHGHPLAGVVAHGKGGRRPSRHGHAILGHGDTETVE